MANIYELGISRQVVEKIVDDCGLSLYTPGNNGKIVDNLMFTADKPRTFIKLAMDGKPGVILRVGQIQTEVFTGEGLHFFFHSGSEGYLDTLELDRRLRNSLERQSVIFKAVHAAKGEEIEILSAAYK